MSVRVCVYICEYICVYPSVKEVSMIERSQGQTPITFTHLQDLNFL